MRTQSLAFAVALIVSGAVGGCRAISERVAESPQQWSTKDQSVLARDPVAPRLEMPERPDLATTAAMRESAIELLRQAADSTNALLRAHAIEGLHGAPEALDPVVRRALGDDNRGVRFVAAMTVGELEMRSAADLVEALRDDPSPSVQAAAIYALRRCGRRVDPTPLGAMAMSDDPEVKANAVLVIGELGDASALPLLREALYRATGRIEPSKAKIVDLQIAEAMVRLGRRDELEVIRAALFAPDEQAEITALACQMCGRLGDRASIPTLKDMAWRAGRDREVDEVRLAAAQALAMMNPHWELSQVPLAYVGSDRYELRSLAATALGWNRDPAALPALAVLLEDANALVQVAVAGAIVRITGP